MWLCLAGLAVWWGLLIYPVMTPCWGQFWLRGLYKCCMFQRCKPWHTMRKALRWSIILVRILSITARDGAIHWCKINSWEKRIKRRLNSMVRLSSLPVYLTSNSVCTSLLTVCFWTPSCTGIMFQHILGLGPSIFVLWLLYILVNLFPFIIEDRHKNNIFNMLFLFICILSWYTLM